MKWIVNFIKLILLFQFICISFAAIFLAMKITYMIEWITRKR